ncbi:MAG: hypothetical protein ACMG57_03500 [Candidatus Dojkabacteria bacterium]
MIIKLVKKLPTEQQGVLKNLKEDPKIDEINTFKAKFSDNDILNEFHNSAKAILIEKVELIKDKLIPEKQQQLEDLVKLIGVF